MAPSVFKPKQSKVSKSVSRIQIIWFWEGLWRTLKNIRLMQTKDPADRLIHLNASPTLVLIGLLLTAAVLGGLNELRDSPMRVPCSLQRLSRKGTDAECLLLCSMKGQGTCWDIPVFVQLWARPSLLLSSGHKDWQGLWEPPSKPTGPDGPQRDTSSCRRWFLYADKRTLNDS